MAFIAWMRWGGAAEGVGGLEGVACSGNLVELDSTGVRAAGGLEEVSALLGGDGLVVPAVDEEPRGLHPAGGGLDVQGFAVLD